MDTNIDLESEPSYPAKCGQTMTEYALILAAIAIVAIVAYTTLGTTIVTLVNNIIACLSEEKRTNAATNH